MSYLCAVPGCQCNYRFLCYCKGFIIKEGNMMLKRWSFLNILNTTIFHLLNEKRQGRKIISEYKRDRQTVKEGAIHTSLIFFKISQCIYIYFTWPKTTSFRNDECKVRDQRWVRVINKWGVIFCYNLRPTIITFLFEWQNIGHP